MKISLKTVLVIEDEESLLSIIAAKLEKKGMNVITSRSVARAFSVDIEKDAGTHISMRSIEEALNHLDALERVGAVWLDHNLLGSDTGIEFVTKLKANGGRWKKIPIFVVSNTSNPDLVKEYAKLNVKNYYVKAEHTLEHIVSDVEAVMTA